jgi:lactate permease
MPWGQDEMWNQHYDPFNNATASTIAAALPVVTLLVLIASNKVKAHIAAIVALIVATSLPSLFSRCRPTCRCLQPCSAQ